MGINMKKFSIALVVFVAFAQWAVAQDLRTSYQRGKEQLRTGNFESARRSFNEILSTSDRNVYKDYALFYLGMVELRAGNPAKAREEFLRLEGIAPGWERKDDLNYWIARSEFELGKFPAAFRQIEKIRSLSVLRDAQAMEAHFVEKIEDQAQLESLYNSFPENPRIGAQLVRTLIKSSDPSEQTRARVLREKFNISTDELFDAPAPSLVKDEYHAAVLLPFMLSELSAGGNYRNSVYLDLLAGMEIARNEWLQEGLRLNLYPYDTRRDQASLNSLLNSPEIKGMDFLIGPGLEANLPMLAKFAEDQKMALINPLGINNKDYPDNPFLLSGRPGNETMAKKAADFASKNFSNRSVVIVYGSSARDLDLATMYRAEMEKRGFRILAMEMVQGAENTSFFNRLRSLQVGQGSPGFGHVFVAGDAPGIVANVLSIMTVRGDNVPIIGLDSWLSLSGVSHEQMERLGIYFLGNASIEYSKPDLASFRDTFIKRNGMLPPYYAYLGYDLIKVMGQFLKDNGTQFQAVMKEAGFIEGKLTGGYIFGDFVDNQYLPIFQIKGGELIKVSE
jgi:ABC-type branched-subunit amino acid transport system substrate-binding protein